MSESGDYSPSGWAGHDFANARRSYRDYADTSLSRAVKSGKTVDDLVPVSMSTKSSSPVAVVTDETGSMNKWPETMFSKLPYLEHEAKTEYFDADVEFSWAAIGDAHNGENYPLQVRPFTKGRELATRLKELVLEGQGGGTMHETYEYAALYYARNVEMPNAIRPLLIFIGDESPYDFVDPDIAERIAHVKLEKRLSTKSVFEELKQKFSVYFIQKPYSNECFSDGKMPANSKEVHENWARLVGKDHIALLDDPGRVVDVIFGIMAKEAGKIPYFREELEERQKPDQVETVFTALKTIHAIPNKNSDRKLLTGRSVTRKPA